MKNDTNSTTDSSGNKQDDPINLFQCALCNGFPVDSETCKHCQSIFCSMCINSKLSEFDNHCPSCKELYTKYPLNPRIVKLLNSYTVNCIFATNGCKELLNYESLNSHKDICKFKPACCEICSEIINNIDLQQHKDKCALVEQYCDSCGFKAKRINFKHSCDMIIFFKNTIKENSLEERKYNFDLINK